MARQVSAEGRSRAFAGGVSVPAATLTGLGEPLVAVHGQSDQHRLLRVSAQRDALDAFAGPDALGLREDYVACHHELRRTESDLDDVVRSARERAREADLLRFGLGEVEAVAPTPGEDATLAAEESRLGFADTLRTAAEQARVCLSADEGPDALGAVAQARKLLDGVARPRRRGRGARRPAGRGQLPPLRRGRRRRVVLLRAGDRPRPAGGRLRAPGGADRPDPQVRRHRRRGPGLGRELRAAAARPRPHRRAHRRAAPASR